MAKTIELPLCDLVPTPKNARKTYPKPALVELSNSIAESGLLENLVVVRSATGQPEVIAGERRRRAMVMLVERGIWQKDHPVDCRVITTNGLIETLAENIQREDVPIWEIGEHILLLQREMGLSQKMIADKLGKSQQYVSMAAKLAKDLSPKVVEKLQVLGKEAPGMMKLSRIADQKDKNTRKPDTGKQMKMLERLVVPPQRKAVKRSAEKVIERTLTQRFDMLKNAKVPAHAAPIVDAVVAFLGGTSTNLLFPKP